MAPHFTTNQRASLAGFSAVTATVVCYVADVVLGAAVLVKKPLSAILAISVCGILILTTVSSAIGLAESFVGSYHLCRLLPFSFLPSCRSSLASTLSARGVDFPNLMSIQHRALDSFVGQSTAGSDLALNIKHAELAVHDLIGMVRGSNLTNRQVLSDALLEFVYDAKEAGRGLQLFSAKVHTSLDGISAFNAHALHELQVIRAQGVKESSHAALTRTFWMTMETFSAYVSRLILEATRTAGYLDRLEERLVTAHMLCTREEFITADARDELLWRLWTILGGNRKQLRDLKNRSVVLCKVQEYRSLSAAYIAAAMQSLMAIEADLTELRDRLAGGDDLDIPRIPIEVHIASIEGALCRLLEEKLKGRGKGVLRREFERVDAYVYSTDSAGGLDSRPP
ncbi:hypothetical protein NUW54_g10991 [Trametes sanguinea]|uniref:Uncharacterized protein n=1 Tax=Trametes sanguinea TaxID=158606 RepID=A0ACC1NN82_9APHY|nr:hypothetical protein NUW54_g10991 [Trametes sanguinea]